jgi:hypothetical protein
MNKGIAYSRWNYTATQLLVHYFGNATAPILSEVPSHMSHMVQADPGDDWRNETRQHGSLPERNRGYGLDALGPWRLVTDITVEIHRQAV